MENEKSAWTEYLATGSIHRAAVKFGVCGETLRQRLIAAGFNLNRRKWAPEDELAVRDYYKNTPDSEFSISSLALKLNRTFASVAKRASSIGVSGKRTDKFKMSDSHLANMARKRKENGAALTQEQRIELGNRVSAAWRKQGHPRGMKGKHHTDSVRRQISASQAGKVVPPEITAKQMRTRLARYGSISPKSPRGSWKSEWVTIGGQNFFSRSRWESNYAHYLEWLRNLGEIREWCYEPDVFKFPNNTYYIPDFRIVTWSGETEYHEVKGWIDARSKRNALQMRCVFPAVRLLTVDSKRYKVLCRNCLNIVPGWVK